MTRKQSKRIAMIAVVHFCIMMGCLFLGYCGGMAGFDDPGKTSGVMVALGIVGMGAGMVLMMPGALLWGLVQGVLPGFLEWLIVLLNSVLWGVAINALLEVRSRCFRRAESTDEMAGHCGRSGSPTESVPK